MKEQTHKEIIELQQKLERLDTAVNHIEDAKKLSENITENEQSLQEKYSEHLQEVKELSDTLESLADRSEALIAKIDKIDFPNRLDKLDATVSGINQGLQNVQTKLENISKDLKDDLNKQKTDILSQSKSNAKNIKTLKIFVYVLTILNLGLIALTIVQI